MPGTSRSFGSYSLQLWEFSPAVLVLTSNEPSHSSPANQLLTREGSDKSPLRAAIATLGRLRASGDVQAAWRGMRVGIFLCLGGG